MTYNFVDNEVIVADNDQKIIFGVKLDDYSVRKIISTDIGNICGISHGKW